MQRFYLIAQKESLYANRGKALIRPGALPSDWAALCFPGANPDLVVAFSVDGATATEDKGLFFEESGLSRDGMQFTIFAEPKTTREELARAKGWLRRTRDVVGIDVFHVTEWIDEKGAADGATQKAPHTLDPDNRHGPRPD